MKEAFNEVRKLAPRASGVGWPIAAGVLLVALLVFSVQDVQPGEVAVKVNNLTGTQVAITNPGWTTRLPLIHTVYILDAKPQTFSMKDRDRYDELHVEELGVRARDGSNFHFTDTTIIFQLAGDMAVTAVRNAGLDYGYLQWMKPYARSVLRDEFGRESTIDVSDPTKYGGAANRAREELNKALQPQGVLVTQLVTPRPRFNEGYEKAIEDRNALSNELEVIRSNLDRAETNRDRELAVVDQKKNRIIQEKRAALETSLATAVAEQADAKREADTYRIAQIGEGQAVYSGDTERARELKGELQARLQSKRAEIAAFRQQPVERVMEKLGEKLSGVTVEIQPWADDSTPSRIRYENKPSGAK